MKSRIIVASLALLASLSIGYAVSSASVDVTKKWTIVNLTEVTWIAGKFASGPVIFVHDDARMAKGEPCTSVHKFVPGKGAGEEIVGFHCKPRMKRAPDAFTMVANRSADGTRILTEYQFAGDGEAHAVPYMAHVGF